MEAINYKGKYSILCIDIYQVDSRIVVYIQLYIYNLLST